jgi:hypothetical protein
MNYGADKQTGSLFQKYRNWPGSPMTSISRPCDQLYGGTGQRRAGRAVYPTRVMAQDDIRHTNTNGLILTLLSAPKRTFRP